MKGQANIKHPIKVLAPCASTTVSELFGTDSASVFLSFVTHLYLDKIRELVNKMTH